MKGFRLAAVLRARQAQEDVAKAAAARARAEADAASGLVLSRERDLADRHTVDESSATAFTATMRARQALAGALAEALGAASLANESARARLDELAEASARRRALEQLAERHAAQQRAAEEAAERAALDELSAAAHHRRRSGRTGGTRREEP
jgi:flagellar export protein FliJ